MPGALIGKKLRLAVHVLAQKAWIANLEQTIESIYFLVLFDELCVCGELGFDATSCLEHDLAFRNVRKWFRVTQSFFVLPHSSFLKVSVRSTCGVL